MCGRFTLTADAERLYEEFGIGVPPDYQPRWNVAPGQPILAVAGPHDDRRAGWLLWGLTPFWARRRPSRPLVNLRADRLHRTVPRLLEQRRCLIPADGFFEWLRRDGRRQPFLLRPPDASLIAMAALWDRQREPQDEDDIRTTAIITVDAEGAVKRIHDRMPLILDGDARDFWLARDTPPDTIRELLAGHAPPLDAIPVSTRVNDARNDDPECIQPV